MLRVGVHITVNNGPDGSAIVEIMSTQTVINPDNKNPSKEVEATVETLDRMVDDAKAQYHNQMLDFGKIVAGQ